MFLRLQVTPFVILFVERAGSTFLITALKSHPQILALTEKLDAPAFTEEDEVISYDCDLALGEYIRNTVFNFAKHRRIEHYRLITERTGVAVEPAN